MKQDYEQKQTEYAKVREKEVETLIAFLLGHTKLSGENCLVAGCGVGAEARVLARLYKEVLAIDHDAAQVEIAKKLGGTNIVYNVADVHRWLLEYPHEPMFDLLTVFDVDTNLFLEQILESASPLLRKNGKIIVTERSANSKIYGRMLLLPLVEKIKKSMSKNFYAQLFQRSLSTEPNKDAIVLVLTKVA